MTNRVGERRAAVLAEIQALAHERLGVALGSDRGSASAGSQDEKPVEDLLLVEDLGLDSVMLLTLAVEVEDHFLVCLDATDEEAIASLGDLADIVVKKQACDQEKTDLP